MTSAGKTSTVSGIAGSSLFAGPFDFVTRLNGIPSIDARLGPPIGAGSGFGQG